MRVCCDKYCLEFYWEHLVYFAHIISSPLKSEVRFVTEFSPKWDLLIIPYSWYQHSYYFSDSPKKRRRYTFLKRRNPSPKLGSAGSKGQGKLSSATDSDAEKARPNRRRRRKSNRKVTQSPSSDEAIGGGQGN